MAKYLITGYLEHSRLHTVRGIDESDYVAMVDLFVDSTFPCMDGVFNEKTTLEEAKAFEKSLVGKIVEIDNFTPLSFAACNVKILTNK